MRIEKSILEPFALIRSGDVSNLDELTYFLENECFRVGSTKPFLGCYIRQSILTTLCFKTSSTALKCICWRAVLK